MVIASSFMPPLRLYFAFAPEDRELAEEVELLLRPLQNAGSILVWSRDRPLGGSPIEEVRTEEIGNADLLIAMLSPGFLANEESFFVLDAMRRRAVPLLSILLAPCLFEATAYASFRVLMSERAVSTYPSRSQAFGILLPALRAELAALGTEHVSVRMPVAGQKSTAVSLPASVASSVPPAAAGRRGLPTKELVLGGGLVLVCAISAGLWLTRLPEGPKGGAGDPIQLQPNSTGLTQKVEERMSPDPAVPATPLVTKNDNPQPNPPAHPGSASPTGKTERRSMESRVALPSNLQLPSGGAQEPREPTLAPALAPRDDDEIWPMPTLRPPTLENPPTVSRSATVFGESQEDACQRAITSALRTHFLTRPTLEVLQAQVYRVNCSGRPHSDGRYLAEATLEIRLSER